MERLLIIDDDKDLCELLTEYLTPEGFAIDTANDGQTGMKQACRETYELIVLDVMLPEVNGFAVLRHLRSAIATPVIMLTARGDDVDRIVGLEMGADDYLPKPFNPRELVARIRAVLRRVRPERDDTAIASALKKLRIGDVAMDLGARVVIRGAERVDLTSVEFNLLEYLLRNAGQLVPREELIKAVLGRSLSPYDRSIDVHVSKLRKKLGNEAAGMERIKTVRSIGYLYALTPPAEESKG